MPRLAHVLSWGVSAWLLVGTAAAQTTPAAGSPAASEQDQQGRPAEDLGLFEEVVVTASAGGATKLESSISVSSVDSEEVLQSTPRSTAEVFRNIVGVRSESTGGQGNANIAVRGLPVAAGGAKFLQLHEDGLPVIEFGDISFGNADIFVRTDSSLDRIEAVRGGTSSTYASNSPGGVINFISKVGSSSGGTLNLTQGLDYRNSRVDMGYGTMAGRWGFYASGFYRGGEGVRREGYTAENGGQVKANLTRYFDNGYARAYFKYLNDRAVGYLPMPVQVTGSNSNPTFSNLPNFDPGSDTPHSSLFLRDVGLDGNNNRRLTNLADGMHPVSSALGGEVSFQLEKGWTVSDKIRVSSNAGRFVSPFPSEVASAAAIAPTIGGTGARILYANGPNAGAAYSGIVMRTHLFNTEINDFGNAVNDLQLARDFTSGEKKTSLRLGYYKSHQAIAMDWVWNSYLLELNGNDAALLNVVGADGTLYSKNGLYAYGVPFWGNCCQRSYDTAYDIDAPYAAVSYASGPLTVDASLRHDIGRANGTYAGTLQASNVDVDGDGRISAVEKSVSLIDNGSPSPVNYDWHYTSFSSGANYLLSKDVGTFARFSRGARANADRLLFGVVQPDGSVRKEDAVDFVHQVEGGLKLRRRNVSLFATGFYAKTEEQNYEATSQRFLDRQYQATGVETEIFSRFGALSVNGGFTLTHATIASDQISPANAGNRPRRQAALVYQATAQYGGEKYRGGLNLVGTSGAYTQDNNDLVMPGYAQVNLFATARIATKLTLQLGVNNAFNTFGITEAEEGSITNNTVNYIRARSIAGRTSSVSLRYDF